MGLDFIRKAAKSFTKSWDDSRRFLGTADLFTKELSSVARSLSFELSQNVNLSIGDNVTVEANGTALIARHSLTEVARSQNPPAQLLKAVQESCGIAKGTVEQVYRMAHVVEISLC